MLHCLLALEETYAKMHMKYLKKRLLELGVKESNDLNNPEDTMMIIGYSNSEEHLHTNIAEATLKQLPVLVLAGYAQDAVELSLTHGIHEVEVEIKPASISGSVRIEGAFQRKLDIEQTIFKVDSEMAVSCSSRIPLATSFSKPHYPVVVDASVSPLAPIIVCTGRLEQIHGDTSYGDQLKLFKGLLSYILYNRRIAFAQSAELNLFANEELIRNSPLLFTMLLIGERKQSISKLVEISEQIHEEYPWLQRIDERDFNDASKIIGVSIEEDMVTITSASLFETMISMKKSIHRWISNTSRGE
ncbi:MAG: hypothetical protein ACFFER_00870 [Candidatus Thorarchaeota archaeon]